MSFELKKYKELFEDMRRRSAVLTDFEVGSVTRTIFESFSYELALLYEKMQLVYLSAYVDSATGSQLDQVVSILGVKRGQPDYAQGVVIFTRDPGKEDIVIPLGTLIATEDSPESPKKVYQTIEEIVIRKEQSEAKAKVQAMDRGSEMDTDPETVIVMPRPIPGVKAVNNPEAIALTGKQRETDEELKERAKNALISSGNATVLSIENAVLKLPGVRDVKVKEDFYYAKGKLTFRLKAGQPRVPIPKGTSVTAALQGAAGPVVKTYRTQDGVTLPDGDTEVVLVVRAVEKDQAGVIDDPTGVTAWNILDPTVKGSFVIAGAEPVKLSDFGVIEVFVDGPDFSEDPDAKLRIKAEIDRVRAAGIFVILDSAKTVRLNGIFRIAPNAQRDFTLEERSEFEENIRRTIRQFVAKLKMGKPFLFAQLIKEVLNLENVENLDDFQLRTLKKGETGDIQQTFSFSDKKIDLQEFERLLTDEICVASEDKPLPIDIAFKASGINAERLATTVSELTQLFAGFQRGNEVEKIQVRQKVAAVSGIGLEVASLRLKPRPWCPRIMLSEDGEKVLTSFVEIPALGRIFGYKDLLDLTGAVLLSLSDTLSPSEKTKIEENVRKKLEEYLDKLGPEEPLLFEDLAQAARSVENVLDAKVEPADFVLEKNNIPLPGQVEKDKIKVNPFEKIGIKQSGANKFLCVTDAIENVNVEVTGLTAELMEGTAVATDLKEALKGSINTFLSGAKAGQNISYGDFKSALDSLLPFADYTIKQFNLKATSECDGRIQEVGIGNPVEIHIRSIETARMTPVTDAGIAINIITPPAPPA